jgi:hypothetical protein
MQVIAALVRANKSHDFLFLPGQGHGSGGQFGTRMRNDYFVRHLLGVNPPDWNRMARAGAAVPGATPGGDLFSGDWLEVPSEEFFPRSFIVW